MSSSNCCFLTCIQISQEAGQVFWYSHLLKNFPQFIVIHTVKGFGIVNKAEVDVFLELSCFFDDPVDVDNLISGSSAFSKSNLNTQKFTVHVLLKPCLENFERYFASMCGGNEDNGNLLQKVPSTRCHTQCPRPCSSLPSTHASTGDAWTLTGKSGAMFGALRGNAKEPQRKAMPKNVQTTAQLHSFHMLAK